MHHHRPEDATLTGVTHGLGRVLVVDDDEVIRRLIAVNLQLEGFDVETAVDGQDCLERVAEIDPDVITLDVMMPRLDGWETAVQLRKSPETAHIKMAGLNPYHEFAQALDAGKLLDVHLNGQKPLRFDQDLSFGSDDLKDAFFTKRMTVVPGGTSTRYVGLM